MTNIKVELDRANRFFSYVIVPYASVALLVTVGFFLGRDPSPFGLMMVTFVGALIGTLYKGIIDDWTEAKLSNSALNLALKEGEKKAE